jgi:hypothetical protein
VIKVWNKGDSQVSFRRVVMIWHEDGQMANVGLGNVYL